VERWKEHIQGGLALGEVPGSREALGRAVWYPIKEEGEPGFSISHSLRMIFFVLGFNL
jgi:hypothetical protein